MITVANVANASRVELLCITYELFLHHIEEALKKDKESRQERINHAKEVLLNLTEDLNFEMAIASDLFNIYIYVQNILINFYKEDNQLKEAYELIEMIYQSYLKLAMQEKDAVPVMQNTENIYAGMTYGKGYLNEMVMQDTNRGFKA